MMLKQATAGAARAVGVRTFSSSSIRPDMARMQLLGRLVADPEQRTTRNGKDYVKYTVATTDPLGPPSEDGERPQPTTSFHNVFAFGEGPVSRLTKLTKGTQVIVDADFRVQYQPSESGDGGSTNFLVQHRTYGALVGVLEVMKSRPAVSSVVPADPYSIYPNLTGSLSVISKPKPAEGTA